MKKIKLIIDIFMLFILIILYNLSFSGILIHEILGILIWLLFIIHLFLNYKWIISITKNISNVKKGVKKIYIIDVLLFITFIMLTISGIKISQFLFTSFNDKDLLLWSNIHNYASNISLLLISVHLIMHFKFFYTQFNNKIKNQQYSKTITMIFIILSIFILCFNILLDKIKSIFINKIDETEYISDDYNDQVIEETGEDNKEESVTENNDEGDSTSVEEENDDTLTLSEYLSKLFCTGCGRRCPLSNPQCKRGESQAKEATDDYNELYT
ncbi:MAG: DUF4405 domain-containing protein [Bacilli bacterium]|nr:DUF4405 domain-containing protein [Bacilli bacterium]